MERYRRCRLFGCGEETRTLESMQALGGPVSTWMGSGWKQNSSGEDDARDRMMVYAVEGGERARIGEGLGRDRRGSYWAGWVLIVTKDAGGGRGEEVIDPLPLA
jgi:hypothetical protein